MALYTQNHLIQGKRMLARHRRVRGKNFTRLGDDATFICQQILKKTWTGVFYKTSLGHYPVFYARDFAMVVDALLELGYRDRVIKTLRYALTQYRRAAAITSFISSNNKPIQFPNVYSPDSVAYMLRSVAIVDDAQLTSRFKHFLQEQVNIFASQVVHPVTGEVKRHIHLQGMRDHSKRDSSCYDAVMCGVVSWAANKLGLKNPLIDIDYSDLIQQTYWTGTHFKDDQSSSSNPSHITADANIYPFWLRVCSDTNKLRTAICTMQFYKLDKPFPIRYVASSDYKGKTIFAECFVPNWEANAVWPMSGLPFIDIVSRVDKTRAKEYLLQYKKIIEQYGTLVEVFTQNAKPYKSWWYSADEGMIWAANYLVLAKRLLHS
ncbi:MAG: hypothetical protein ACOCQQ_02750 [Candidatus Nanoarchaeia archaeon]